MRTHTLHLEDLNEPMTQYSRLERGVRCLEPGGDAQQVTFFPNALLLREPECSFAEACLVSARESSAADDELYDIPLAHFPQQWQHVLTEPVPAVLE